LKLPRYLPLRKMAVIGWASVKFKIMSKRKYTKWGEEPVRYECTKRKCKWQGKDEEKARKPKDEYMTEHVCPKCGNNEFYGLLS
jgi:hypothetical protein